MTTATETPRIYVADSKLNKLEQKEIEFVQGLFKKTFTSFGESLPRVFWMRDQEGGSAIVSNVAVVAPTEWQQQFQPVSRSYIPEHNVSETDLQVVTWVVKAKRSVNFDAYVTMITALCDYQRDRAARMSQQVKGDLLSVEEEGLIRLNDPRGLVCEELKQSLTIGPYEDGDMSSPEILAYIDARIYYLRNLIDSGLFDDMVFCQTISLVMSTLMSQVPTRQRLASVKTMATTLTELRDDLTHLVENVMMFLLLGCQEPESLSLPASARFSVSGLSSATLARAISGGITGLRVRPVAEEGLKQILESPSGICVQILIFHRVFYRLFPSTSGIRMEFDDNPFFYFKDSCAYPLVPPLATPNQYSHYGKTLVSTIQQNPAHIDKLVCIHGWLLELARLVIHSDNMIYISGTSPSLLGYRPVVKAVERTLRAQEDFVSAISESINQLRQLTKLHGNVYETTQNLARSLSVLTHRCIEKSQKLQKQLKSSLFRCRNPETAAVLPLEIQDLILQSSILSGKAEIFLNVRPQVVDFSAPPRSLQPVSASPSSSLDWDQVLYQVRRRQLSLYKREQQPKAPLLLQTPSGTFAFEPSPVISRVPPPPPPSPLALDANTSSSSTSPITTNTAANNTTSSSSPPKLIAIPSASRTRAYSPVTMKNFLTYLEKEIEGSGLASELKTLEAVAVASPVVLKGRELTKAERLFIRAMSKNWSAEEQPTIVSRHYQIQGELHLHNGSPLLAIECFTRALELLPQRTELAHAIATARSSSPVLVFSQRSAGLETGEVACQLLLCQTLMHIDLTCNQLGPLAIPSLLTVFRWLPGLTILSLGSNNITDEGLKSVTAFLNDSVLTQLDVSYNGITVAGAQHLAAALVINSTLQHLNISGNLIQETGASALCAAWFRNPKSGLEVLDLRETGLDSTISVATMQEWLQQPVMESKAGDEDSAQQGHRKSQLQTPSETVGKSGRWLLVSLAKKVQVELTLEEGLLPLRARLIPPRRDSLAEAVQQIQDELTYVFPCPIWSNGGFDVSQPQLQEFFEQRLNSHVSNDGSHSQRSLSPQNSPSSASLYKGPSLLRWFCELEASRPRKPAPDVDNACRDLLRALYHYQIERCQGIGEWLSIKDHFALNDPMNAFCEEWKEWVLRFYSGVKPTDEMDKIKNRLTFLRELSGLCSGIRAQVITGPDGQRRMGPRVPFAPRQWPSLLPLASPQFTALLEQMSNILVQYLTREEMEHVRKSYHTPVTAIVLSAPHLLEVCLLFLFLVYRNPALASPSECTSFSTALLRANLRDNLDFAKPAHSSSGQLFMHLLKSSPLEFFFPSILQVPSLDLAVIDFENPFWDPSGAPRLPRGVMRPAGAVHEAGDTNPTTLALVCQHQGFLGKARRTGLGYSRRYFILHLDRLYYYKEKTDLKPADVIVLRRETVAQEDPIGSAPPHTFYLITERGGERRIFAAETDAAKHEWLHKIKANLNTISEEKSRAEATAGIRFRGYLWKTGSQGLKTAFKKRFVILTDDRLRYFVSHDAEKPKGEVVLSGQTEIMPIHDSPRPNTFYLENEKSGRKFYFAAEIDYKDWLNAITICCADLRNEMRAVQMNVEEDVIWSGYLFKMAGETSLTKSYQKRFFRLYANKLVYYGKENEAKKGEIVLTPRSVVVPLSVKDGKRAHAFYVASTPTDRKYLLAGEDAITFTQWTQTLKTVIDGTQRSTQPLSRVLPTVKGFLGKTGTSGLKKGFSRRYCILTQDRLQYFKSNTDRKPKGEIMIVPSTTCTSNLYAAPNVFQWVNPDRIWYFQCESGTERTQWLQAINSRLKKPEINTTTTTSAATKAPPPPPLSPTKRTAKDTPNTNSNTNSNTSSTNSSNNNANKDNSNNGSNNNSITNSSSNRNEMEDERDPIVAALGGMDELCSGIDELAVQRDPQKLKDFVYLHGSLFALAQAFILIRKLAHALDNPNFLRRPSAVAHTNNALSLVHGLLGATKEQLNAHFEVFQDFKRKDKCVPALFARLSKDIESMLRVTGELSATVCKVLLLPSLSSSLSSSSPSSFTSFTSDANVSPWLESLEVELAVFVNTVNLCLPPAYQINPQKAPRPPASIPSALPSHAHTSSSSTTTTSASVSSMSTTTTTTASTTVTTTTTATKTPPPPPPSSSTITTTSQQHNPQQQPTQQQQLYLDVNPQVLSQILSTKDLKERATKLASLATKLQTHNARAAVGVYALAIECDPTNTDYLQKLAKSARASMKRLLFNRSSLQDGDLTRVLSLIQDHVIVELDVSCNFLGPVAISALCNAMKQCEKLTHLSLADNKLGNDEQAIKSLTELLLCHPSLEHVNLSNLQITDLGAQCLASALKTNRTLVSLDLSNNPVADEGVAAVCESLRSNIYSTIEKLNVSRTQITDNGAKSLWELLACAAALEEIGLIDCKIERSVVDNITTKLNLKRKPFEGLSNKKRMELREFRQSVLQESAQTFFTRFFDINNNNSGNNNNIIPTTLSGPALRALRAFCVPQKSYQLSTLISEDPHAILSVYEGLLCLTRLHYGLSSGSDASSSSSGGDVKKKSNWLNPQVQADILGCKTINESILSCDSGLWSFILSDWGKILWETANKLYEQCLQYVENILELSVEDPECVIQALAVLVKFNENGVNDLSVSSKPHLLEVLTLRNWAALPLCSVQTAAHGSSATQPAFLVHFLQNSSRVSPPLSSSIVAVEGSFKENSSLIATNTIAVVQKRWLALITRYFSEITKGLRGNAEEVVATLQGLGEERVNTNGIGPIYFFTKFLASECSEENMEFWHAVNKFLTNPFWALEQKGEGDPTDIEKLWEESKKIAKTFIGSGALRQVNIASNIESDLKKAVSIEDDLKRVLEMKGVLTRAREEVVKLMTADSFRRFVRSPFWAEYLASGDSLEVTLKAVRGVVTDLQLVVTHIIPIIDERWKVLQFFLATYEEHATKLVDPVQNAVSPPLDDVAASVHFLDWTAELYLTLSSQTQPPNVVVNDYGDSLHSIALEAHRQGLKRRIMIHINSLLNRTWAEMQKNVMVLANSEKNAVVKGSKSDGFNTNSPLKVFDCIKNAMSQCFGVVNVSPRAEARLAQLGVHAFDLFSHHLGSLLTEAQIAFAKSRLPALVAKLQPSIEEPVEGDDTKFDFEAVLTDRVDLGETKQTMVYIYAQASNADLLWSLLDEMKKSTLNRIAEAQRRINGDDDVEAEEGSMFHEFDECFAQCRALLAPCLDIIVYHSFMRFSDVFSDIFLPSWFADPSCASTVRMLDFVKQLFKHFNTVTTTEGSLNYPLSKKVLEELMNEYASRFMTYRDDEALTHERALQIHTHISAVMSLIRQHFEQLLDARSVPWIQSELAVLECIRALILLSHAQSELFDGQFERFRAKLEVSGSRFWDLPGLSPRIVLQECLLNRHHPHSRFHRATSL